MGTSPAPSSGTPAERPREIGQRPLRLLLILFIASFAAMIGVFVLAALYRSRFANDLLVPAVSVAVALLALALGCAPGIAFLLYARSGLVTPSLRRSALASAIAPAVVGLFLVAAEGSGTVVLEVLGVALLLLAALIIARAFTAPRAGPGASPVVLRPAASFVPVALVALAYMSRPHGPTPASVYRTAMKSDLRNLAQAQEEYFDSTKRFHSDPAVLQFRPSTGVHAPGITLSDSGWSATNTHSKEQGARCGIAFKAKNPVNAATPDGEPACTEPPK